MKLLPFVLLITTASSAQNVYDQAVKKHGPSGGELYLMCNGVSPMDYGFCLGYLNSQTAFFNAARVANHAAECVPPMENRNLVDIYTAYAPKYPEMVNLPATLTILSVFGDYFKCK